MYAHGRMTNPSWIQGTYKFIYTTGRERERTRPYGLAENTVNPFIIAPVKGKNKSCKCSSRQIKSPTVLGALR